MASQWNVVRRSALAVAVLGFSLVYACTNAAKLTDERTKDGAAGAPSAAAGTGTAASTAGVRLKGAALLAESLYTTLGSGKDQMISVPSASGDDDQGNGQTAPSASVFDRYAANFGQTDGLRFGAIYPDGPSAGYLLALSILANTAANNCAAEIAQGKAGTLCNCATPTDAQAMMTRAMPQVALTGATGTALVNDFAALCKSDYVDAVTSLIASLAFASR